MTKISFIYLLLLLVQNARSDDINSNLKQLHVVFRHGERAPTETYKNDPYANMSWPGGWGHLTNRGKLEMYSLGLKLRKIYGNFIPGFYFADDVQVTSSYSDRCLMSAQALLAGLFPPKGEQIWNENLMWQPIPVHYVPRSQDSLIAMRAKCKTYDKEFEKILNSQAYRKINEDNSELFHFLTEHTGQVIGNIGSVELLYNTLEIELLHNLTLPEWTNHVSLDHMKMLAARYLRVFVENDFMKRMKGGVFIKKVISSMKKTKSGPSVYLYAGHDVTLVNILKTLGYQSMLKPGFGASFILQLQNNNEFKMVYRNDVDSEPEVITILNCPVPCTLTNFEAAMKPLLPVDWDQECNNKDT